MDRSTQLHTATDTRTTQRLSAALCTHTPKCPTADSPARDTAQVVASHPEQGWSLLCNAVLLFEDTGELLPDGRIVAPHRPPTTVAAGSGGDGEPDSPDLPNEPRNEARMIETTTTPASTAAVFSDVTMSKAAELAADSYQPLWIGPSGEKSSGEAVARHLPATWRPPSPCSIRTAGSAPTTTARTGRPARTSPTTTP